MDCAAFVDIIFVVDAVPDAVIHGEEGCEITDTDEIERAIDHVIDNFAKQVMQHRSGQEKVFGFLVGQVMQATGGKANPKVVNKILRDKLSSE